MDKHKHITLPGIIWFTGLSGSGKSTLAQTLSHTLTQHNITHVVLDGDIVRKGLCSDLGFLPDDRTENLRRVREVAALLQDAGILTCVACITPFEHQRALNKTRLDNYLEVYVQCSLETCIERDPKGLYYRALNKDIEHFTGISSPYEQPEQPDLTLNTEHHDLQHCMSLLLNKLATLGWMKHCSTTPS